MAAGLMRKRGRMGARATGLRALAGACLVACLALCAPARAEPQPGAPAAAEARPLPDRVKDVLSAHCPDCRELAAQASELDLAVLADTPRLVVPKRPDASRIYQRLLARGGDAAGPSAADIETVRTWIEGLPARDEACRERTPIAPADVEARIDRWLATVGLTEADDTRFLSLVHLWNACETAAALQQYRDAIMSLLAAHARDGKPLEIESLGDESAILAFRASELRSPPPQGPAGVIGAGATPADWLAAEFLAATTPVALDGATQQRVAALANAWARDVDLIRAAAERGVPPRALAERLTDFDGDLAPDARRLLHALITRAAWNRLARALDGHAVPEKPERPADAPDNAPEIDVLLWTDKPVYRPRDLATVNISVSRSCHLTLIDVDREGKAIVLFPNELEQDNLIAPRVTVRVPSRDAGYQLRFDRAGEEQIVAVCQAASRRLAGIDYDYEKQRFQTLGDWREFLRTADEREKGIIEREKNRAERRRRRGKGAPPAEPEPVPAADRVEGRAAITVVIEPGGGPR